MTLDVAALKAAAIIGTVVAASIAWLRLFAEPRGPLICVLAAILSGTVVAVRRIPAAWTLLISAVSFLIFAAAVAVPIAGVGLPSPGAVRTVLGWLASMVATTLESGLPADAHGPPLLLALAATWLTSAAATALAVRRHARAGALAPAAALWVLALLLGSPRPTSSIALTVPLIAASIVFLALSGPQSEHRVVPTTSSGPPPGPGPWTWTASITRRLLTLGGIVVVAIVAASSLPGTGTAPPTLQRDPKFDPREVISPLARVYPQIASDDPRELFVVRGGTDGLDRITLAVLDEFNGETWQSAGDFRPVGEVAPADPRPADTIERHRITVEIQDLDGPWLPHAARIDRIRLRGMQSDGVDRNHVLPSGTTPGMSYDVESTVVTPTGLQTLVTSAVGAGPDPSWTELPVDREVDDSLDELGSLRACTVSDVVEVARGWTEGVTASGVGADDVLAKVSEIEKRLLEDHGRNPDDEAYGPGHTLSDMCRVLGIGPGDTPRPASEEQFASLMATMVRGIGVPARVAVGYRLPDERADGSRVVTEHDAIAWTDVHLGAAGWVAFDPTPASETSADSETQRVTDMAPSPVPPAPPVTDPPVDPPPTTLPPSTDPEDAEDASSVVGAIAIGGSGLLVLLVAVGLGAIVLYKRRRRSRRRRAGVPNEAVAGAWFEVIDHLRDRGFDPPSGLTERELASQAASATGLPDLRRPMTDLSRLYGRAVYSTQPLDEATPTTAWQLVEGIEYETKQRSGMIDRIRARASVRSLRNRVG